MQSINKNKFKKRKRSKKYLKTYEKRINVNII